MYCFINVTDYFFMCMDYYVRSFYLFVNIREPFRIFSVYEGFITRLQVSMDFNKTKYREN